MISFRKCQPTNTSKIRRFFQKILSSSKISSSMTLTQLSKHIWGICVSLWSELPRPRLYYYNKTGWKCRDQAYCFKVSVNLLCLRIIIWNYWRFRRFVNISLYWNWTVLSFVWSKSKHLKVDWTILTRSKFQIIPWTY